MKFKFLTSVLCSCAALAAVVGRPLFSYAPIPASAYEPPVQSGTITLLSFLKSRGDLSDLTAVVEQVAGFAQAFNTLATWNYTFFAPSNTAFRNTGQYSGTFAVTPKGKSWLGNLLQHHYVPNTALKSTAFNATLQRFQTGSYLYVGAQMASGQLMLKNASAVVEADIEVTNFFSLLPPPWFLFVGARLAMLISVEGCSAPNTRFVLPMDSRGGVEQACYADERRQRTEYE
ncbi:hypothetical protein DL767_006893 [Monosporascus sp. MG133]|nr:hypothetical protein DL767_006893 [Monosporascus sp. MG133]